AAATLIAIMVMDKLGPEWPRGNLSSSYLMTVAGVGLGPIAALALFQAYLLSTRGQTLGKKWIGIRIVRLDGGPVTFFGAVMLRAVVPALVATVPLFGVVFSLADAIFIFREDRRCIHDFIASTKVVRIEHRTA